MSKFISQSLILFILKFKFRLVWVVIQSTIIEGNIIANKQETPTS